MACPYSIIRFYDHRIADFFDKFLTFFQSIYQMIACCRDSRLYIVCFHLRFVFDPRNIVLLKTACDMEGGTESGITLQPVLVVGLQPVDASVLEDQECNRTVYFFLIFETADLIVFIQAVFQSLAQFLIRLISDPEDIQPVFLEFPAEHPVIFRKIWRNKQKIFHNITLSF